MAGGIEAAALVQGFLQWVGVFFILYMLGYAVFLFLSVTVGSSLLYKRKREVRYRSQLTVDCYVPVSIVVPAYNEEVTIVSSLRSLLELDYSLYEIVVVDDGSSDETSQRVIEAFGLHPLGSALRMQLPCQPLEAMWQGKVGRVPLRLIRKVNGGKADALNMGINAAAYPYFICIDADSMLQADSLREITAPLIEDEGVVAVGGLVRLANGVRLEKGRVVSYSLPRKIIPAMQVLEYDRSFLSARILLDQFNGNLIISGAFGLFKKDVVIAAGGYDAGTVGEDMELVTKLHVFCRGAGMRYRIRYAPDAICWSQAPETLRDLRKQRRRWHRGLHETMTRHAGIFLNKRYGLVGLLSYTYFLVYELLSPFIELFGILSLLLGAAFGFVNLPFMVLFFGIYALFGAVMSLTAFFSRVQTRDLSISVADILRALLLSVVEVTALRFVMAVTRMGALLGYRKHKGKWERAERKALNS
ncbi:MAG: glycosyltransferase [Coriobacteriaceae bacterium]|nr:glycosyltransferase [Coriobacteriaceae bacterium]